MRIYKTTSGTADNLVLVGSLKGHQRACKHASACRLAPKVHTFQRTQRHCWKMLREYFDLKDSGWLPSDGFFRSSTMSSTSLEQQRLNHQIQCEFLAHCQRFKGPSFTGFWQLQGRKLGQAVKWRVAVHLMADTGGPRP